jgi:hypothetical protein
LTPHGRQHNVGLNSKNLHRVKQMLHPKSSFVPHVGLSNGFA